MLFLKLQKILGNLICVLFRFACIIFKNFRYRNRVKELAEFAADQPMTGLERAVWWTEYVLRHNDTSHLKPSWASKGFYHEFQLDVFATLVSFLLVFLVILYKTCRVLVRTLIKGLTSDKMKNGVVRCTNIGLRLLFINKVAR